MMDLLLITSDPHLAKHCDAVDGMRLFVDLERLGKAERQAGRNTFISTHGFDDVARIKAVLQRSRLMVRVNPLNPESAHEVDEVLKRGADMLMLPMFSTAQELQQFAQIVAGRAPIVPLLETAGALYSVDDWVQTAGLAEIYIGLNDLHISLGCRFMFEPLAQGHVERVAALAGQHGLRFGFGGIARLDDGLLPGRDVMAEHVRLGSGAVILSRTFQQGGTPETFVQEISRLRACEAGLRARSSAQAEADRVRIAHTIHTIAAGMHKSPSASPVGAGP